ncbi:MAG: methylenetetrahydrofolate reductase C-terminal domain-containing protein [Desulfatibacillaceae bacterium]
MLLTEWKPEAEIRRALGDSKRVVVLSCAVCANLCGTGGARGLKRARRMLAGWGIRTVRGREVLPCCSEKVMREAVARYVSPKRCDALVILACAGGIKAAHLAAPGVPIVGALNSLGSGVISDSDDPVATGVCSGCGHCVLTHTAGICPVHACPQKRMYGPCKKAPDQPGPCAVREDLPCAWAIIRARGGDMEALAWLASFHKTGEPPACPPAATRPALRMARRATVRAMARAHRSGWFIRLIR